ncbi:hypothetical protein HMPREF9374_0360 [Desmospora sp. 8437]|uniref:DUF4227 domain-containing protein n=2 Tax=Kroppenstedtia eburnea TaxID=714067 RepID=A0A1N7IN12_9BACL|nr:hypothetical protein HMPREF9374_0360 [Desmospora sp. 8437]SIS38487.1 Protein of unknown function [Kroppenstedtia eburnea]
MMIIPLRRLAAWAKFLILFVILTLILYQVIAILSQWMLPTHRYGEPKGRAVKVMAPLEEPGRRGDLADIKDRLRMFYWLGE